MEELKNILIIFKSEGGEEFLSLRTVNNASNPREDTHRLSLMRSKKLYNLIESFSNMEYKNYTRKYQIQWPKILHTIYYYFLLSEI